MSLATPDIDFLRDFVVKRSGNVLRPGQHELIESRLAPIAQNCGLQSVEQLIAKLRLSPPAALADKVAEAVTVNETSFFRDVHPFESLRTRILPDVMQRNLAKRDIRIWCAASSTGQEPYSNAMVIRENFPTLNDWTVRIVATDISEDVLTKCRSGEFSQLEVNRGLPAKKLVRFFDRRGNSWQAKPEIRDLIEFRRLNLTTPWPFLGTFDIIFIRNVLIYFDQPTKTDILKRTSRVLHPNGYLFIGSAETIIGLGLPYRREEIDATVCYRPIIG
jgi:chemotaxis protein methyltransferase CheR